LSLANPRFWALGTGVEGVAPEQRLDYHQTHSGPRMKELEQWFAEQFAERKVEPNSGLGQAIAYMQNHRVKLTLFLRQPGPHWITTFANGP
jgi:hypothetical protein